MVFRGGRKQENQEESHVDARKPYETGHIENLGPYCTVDHFKGASY